MSVEYDSVALSVDHDTAGFDCGVPFLNAWLGRAGASCPEAGTARTFLWVAAGAPENVWAYFALAPTEVARDALPRSQSAGDSIVPGYLLARLAVHIDLRGHSYGGELLVDALGRVATAAEAGGGRIVVVDAVDDAATNFYRHYDFVPVKGDPHRLVLKIASVRGLLDMTDPTAPSPSTDR